VANGEKVKVAGKEYEVVMTLLDCKRLGEKYGPFQATAFTQGWNPMNPAFLFDAYAMIVSRARDKRVDADWVAEHMESDYMGDAAPKLLREQLRVLGVKTTDDTDDDEEGEEGVEANPEGSRASLTRTTGSKSRAK
jgi:hypothetical protein